MNDTMTNNRVSPRRAIIVYHDKNRNNFYLESRDIKNGNLMAPVPLADDILKDVARSYMKAKAVEMGHERLMDGCLLHCSNEVGRTVVMWHRPAMKRMLNFSASLRIKGESSVQVPATLYVVINSKLYLFAMMDDSRPERSTKLYNAPFFNIYADGNVCLGTAQVGRKAKTFEKEAERFERAFYMAEQNGGQSEHCKTPLEKLWTQLIKTKSAFPSKKELQQHKKYKTLGALMDNLIGNLKHDDDDYDDED